MRCPYRSSIFETQRYEFPGVESTVTAFYERRFRRSQAAATKLTERVAAVSFFMKIISNPLLLGLAAVGLCLTSCETLDNRISEHQDIFNTLSAGDQALVRAGKIRSGMSMNAVWLAWGSPEQKTSGEMRGHATESWIYVESRT